MLHIDFEADTEKEAVDQALASLGLTMNDITYEVLEKEKKSLFGLGKSQKAKVRIFYKEQSEIQELIETVKKLVLMLDPKARVEVKSGEENKYVLSVESDDSSHLIGRGGKTLQSLQTVVNAILLKARHQYKILVDIDKYYARKERNVIQQAVSAAQKVQRTRESALLQPMNPFERRLVHMELKKMAGIHTESEGHGTFKKIRITYSDAPQRPEPPAQG